MKLFKVLVLSTVLATSGLFAPMALAADEPDSIIVLAKREGKNTEHAAKSVLLKVER